MSDNLKACPSPAKRSDFSSLLGVPRRKGGGCSPPFRLCQDCSARGRRAPERVFSEALVNKPTLVRREGAGPQRGNTRPGTGSLHPVAIRAAVEATRLLKPLVQRVARRLGERAGRNVSER